MKTEILSREEVEEIAYKTAILIQSGWRKSGSVGDWLHPDREPFKTTTEKYMGGCYKHVEVEREYWPLDDAYEEAEGW